MVNQNKKKKISRLSKLFARFHYKLNFGTNNTSSLLLATDLLRDNTKQQLFKIITVNVETIFCTLLAANRALTVKQSKSICFSLVKMTTQEFLLGYYGYKINLNLNLIKDSFYTKFLLSEEKILLTVPLQILLTENSNLFRSIFSPIYSSTYDNFLEALLDNLIIEIANAVMFIIVNEFSSVDEIRKHFYRSNFLSVRNVERFRNNLNWQSRIKVFVRKPSNMYNSQQGIWVLRTTGIYYRTIFANRSQELVHVKRFSLITLFLIETRDFIVSRLDETFYLLGSGLRYFLTSIIGQVIGLIWRGIIESLKK